VKWNGYEWYGLMSSYNLSDKDGNIIPVEQMPFWQKISDISQDGKDYHKYYFMLKLLAMRTGSFEPLGNADLSPYIWFFALFILAFVYLFPNVGNRLHGIIFSEYSEPINDEERKKIRFNVFIGGILLVAFTLIYVTQTIISSWV